MGRGASPDGCQRLDEVVSLLRKLLESAPLYFDRRGVLNSDGRRLVARAARACDEAPVKSRLLGLLKGATLEEAVGVYEHLTLDDGWSLVRGALEAWGAARVVRDNHTAPRPRGVSGNPATPHRRARG